MAENESKLFGRVMSEIELEEWKSRQLERCLYENTVNQLIEAYNLLHSHINASQLRENSQQLVEESAISMAINEHGLQQYEQTPQTSRASPDNYSATTQYDCDSKSGEEEEHLNVLEDIAILVAIQKQGLGLLNPNR